MNKHSINTDKHGLFDITNIVKKDVKISGVKSGLCCVFIPHSTAAVTVYSGIDPLGLLDLNDTIKTLVPTRIDFHHQCDTPSDAAGHIKSSLLNPSMTFIVEDGKIVLGNSQSIYFFEFDGPRNRQFFTQVNGL